MSRSSDECVKFFFGNGIELLEEKYQEWFMKNRKLIAHVLDRKVNVAVSSPIPPADKQMMTYVITIFYILTD